MGDPGGPLTRSHNILTSPWQWGCSIGRKPGPQVRPRPNYKLRVLLKLKVFMFSRQLVI